MHAWHIKAHSDWRADAVGIWHKENLVVFFAPSATKEERAEVVRILRAADVLPDWVARDGGWDGEG